jgi:desampylase
MELALSRQQRQQLLDWAAEAAPEECCGLIFGQNGVIAQLELVANVAADPMRRFELDPKALIAAEKAARAGGTPILGYFHSHPSGDSRPSTADAALAAPDGRIWVILAGREIAAWRAVEDGSMQSRFRPVGLMSQ